MKQGALQGLLTVATVLVLTATVAAATKKSEEVVKVNVSGSKADANGTQTITIELEVDNGYHIYANPIANDKLTASETRVTIQGKGSLDVKIDFPEGKLVKDKDIGDYRTYEGKVQVKATVKRSQTEGPLKVTVKFLACDKEKCLIPAAVEKTVD